MSLKIEIWKLISTIETYNGVLKNSRWNQLRTKFLRLQPQLLQMKKKKNNKNAPLFGTQLKMVSIKKSKLYSRQERNSTWIVAKTIILF
jgi:hypothetical protein